MLLLLWGCVDPIQPTDEVDRCEGSLAPGTVQVFASGFVDPTGTEGLSFGPDGRLYIGGSGVQGGGFVAEIGVDASWEVLTPVPRSVGLAWWQDAVLVATADVGDGSAGLVAVDPDVRTSSVFARGLPGANFAAVTPWNTLLLSDPGGDVLWEVQPDGSWLVWAEGVPSPNGIGFAPDGSSVYVANTYLSPNTVSKIVVQDGVAGPVEVFATLPDGSTQDGVAVDVDGNLYVVNNLPGTLVRITPGGAWEVVAEGVEFGASLAFGEGAFDACSLYVSSLFSEEVFRVGIGVPGQVPYR